MATNLVISYPDIPWNAIYSDTTPDYSSASVIHHSSHITGQRFIRWYWPSASTTPSVRYDMGTGNTATADHVIIARADLLQSAGVTRMRVKRGSDGSAWTDQVDDASFATATLYGPRTNDYISTFATTSAYRWWQFYLDSSSSTCQHSKFHLGMFFDFGYDPYDFRIDLRPASEAYWYSDNGTRWGYRLEQPVHVMDVEWRGISDDNVTSFSNKIARWKHVNPVFLCTKSTHDILNSHRIIHCILDSWSTEQVSKKNDYNLVKARFIEILG